MAKDGLVASAKIIDMTLVDHVFAFLFLINTYSLIINMIIS